MCAFSMRGKEQNEVEVIMVHVFQKLQDVWGLSDDGSVECIRASLIWRAAQDIWLYNKCCGDTNCIFAAFIFLPEKR